MLISASKCLATLAPHLCQPRLSSRGPLGGRVDIAGLDPGRPTPCAPFLAGSYGVEGVPTGSYDACPQGYHDPVIQLPPLQPQPPPRLSRGSAGGLPEPSEP